MRIVVTGGSGFIGPHVVEALRRRGDEPIVVDRHPYPDRTVECVTGDLRDPEVVAAAVAPGTDGIVHLAAAPSVLQSIADPVGVFHNNVGVTQSLLERARDLGVARLVMASTNAVCGDVGERPIDETAPPRPLTPYGATKAAAEMLMSAYRTSYGLGAVAIRLTNVYGRGMQVKDSIIARMMRAILAGDTLQVYGDGEQRRDYVYVTDAVAALLLAFDRPVPGLLTVGGGRSVSVNELIDLTAAAAGRPLAVEHVEAKRGEMRAVVVDTTRARSAGFAPRYGLEEGLAETWDHFSNGPVAAAVAAEPAG